MARLNEGFDTSSTAPSEGRDFKIIPTGTRVRAVISASEVKSTKANDGWYIALTYTVTEEGEYKNRKVWVNVNVRNKNPEAEKIGKADLAAICKAVGFVGNLEDTDVLHEREHYITLGIEKGQNGYDPKNKITKWESLNGGAQVSPHAPKPATTSAAPAASSTPPWGKKPAA